MRRIGRDPTTGRGAAPTSTRRVDRAPTPSASFAGAVALVAALGAAACTPTVRLEVPDRPIEINLNINMKIEQNVRVKLERELDRVSAQNPGIF